MTASVRTLGTLANGLLLQREAAERARSHRGNDRVVQPHPACSAIVTRHALPAGRALVAADIVARRGRPGRSLGRASLAWTGVRPRRGGRLRGGSFRRAGPSRRVPAAVTSAQARGPLAGTEHGRPSRNEIRDPASASGGHAVACPRNSSGAGDVRPSRGGLGAPSRKTIARACRRHRSRRSAIHPSSGGETDATGVRIPRRTDRSRRRSSRPGGSPPRPPAGTRTRADTRSFGEAVRNLCRLVGERHRRSAHVEPATARLARARRTLMRIPGG